MAFSHGSVWPVKNKYKQPTQHNTAHPLRRTEGVGRRHILLHVSHLPALEAIDGGRQALESLAVKQQPRARVNPTKDFGRAQGPHEISALDPSDGRVPSLPRFLRPPRESLLGYDILQRVDPDLEVFFRGNGAQQSGNRGAADAKLAQSLPQVELGVGDEEVVVRVRPEELPDDPAGEEKRRAYGGGPEADAQGPLDDGDAAESAVGDRMHEKGRAEAFPAAILSPDGQVDEVQGHEEEQRQERRACLQEERPDGEFGDDASGKL
ncbi:hypothetical protein CMUS01_13105 [Colletotrichum musicola]|uniref:Uncharacterized protein n=1 Tax=Colletotrichum musicola TaxID=2175873 RepID=A0A8H6MXU5_9PEZI|nr:hypothetical protein CMUS01_13105 [Colletotrichum musicola]